jgi:hypothetical protein
MCYASNGDKNGKENDKEKAQEVKEIEVQKSVSFLHF